MHPSPPPPPAGTSAARLCQACGLCCDGVLFHKVELQPGDSARALAALGLHVQRKHRKDVFTQPCPAFRESCCAIYAQRPIRCRLFECRQLQRVATGETSEAAALARIREVRERVARLQFLALRSDGRPRKGALSRRCETALAEPFDALAHPELIPQREELAHGLRELEAILDADFRLPRPKPSSA